MSKKTLIAAAVGTAFAATLAAPVASAAGNPFELSALASGYQVADNHSATKPMEGKCGGDKKAGEGKCGADKAKMKDGKCGEGKCGADKAKMKDGKCGEGKCGANKPK
jgi:uncharacterized low-complexity protein